MEELKRQEDRDKLKSDSLRTKSFNKEIRDTHDKNLEELLHKSLIDVIEEHNLEKTEILYYIRKFIQKIKENLK